MYKTQLHTITVITLKLLTMMYTINLHNEDLWQPKTAGKLDTVTKIKRANQVEVHSPSTENKRVLTHPPDCPEGSNSCNFWMAVMPFPLCPMPFPYACLHALSACRSRGGFPSCQPGRDQMDWFSMASHQPTQWHVKQAAMGPGMVHTVITVSPYGNLAGRDHTELADTVGSVA